MLWWTESPTGYILARRQVVSPKEDRRSNGLQWNSGAENPLKTSKNRPKIGFTHESNRLRSRENSVESCANEQNRDMVTGANSNPRMVPEFLTGRPMQPREPLQHQNSANEESQDPEPSVHETTNTTTPTDPINRLSEVLGGTNNRPSAQTLTPTPSQHDYTDV